jgi:hypothetical protein
MKNTFQSAIVLFSILFMHSCTSKTTTLLKFNPPQNVPYEFTWQQDSKQKQDPKPGQDSTAQFSHRFTRADSLSIRAQWICVAKNDSISTLEVTIEKISFTILIKMEEGDKKRLFTLLNGYSAIVDVNNKGYVQSVKIKNSPVDTIAKALHSTPYVVHGLIDDYLSENAIKDYFDRIFTVVPNEKIDPDSVWSNTIFLDTKAPVKVNSLYTLQKIIDDTVQLGMTSIISARQTEGGNPYLQGRQTGRVILSYSSGIPIAYETNAETVYSTNYYDVKTNQHFIFSGWRHK